MQTLLAERLQFQPCCKTRSSSRQLAEYLCKIPSACEQRGFRAQCRDGFDLCSLSSRCLIWPYLYFQFCCLLWSQGSFVMQAGDGIWPGGISIYCQRTTACSFFQHLEKYWDKDSLKSVRVWNLVCGCVETWHHFMLEEPALTLVRLTGIWHCKISGCWKADKAIKKWHGNMQSHGVGNCGGTI